MRTATKALVLPAKGDYLHANDGSRLVEVVGKARGGIRVLDATAPIEKGGYEVLPVDEVVKGWTVVTWSPLD